MKIRLKFSKVGPLKFIGHLDTMRYFQKAMRRANIDIAYSGGYSPHQIMSFAAPLGVGTESLGEYFDIEVNSVTSSQDMKKRLNDVMTDGITIIEVKKLDDNARNAMASVMAAAYRVSLKKDHQWPASDMKEVLERFLRQETIPFEKETKTGKHTINLRPGIYEMIMDEHEILHMTVDASSAGNIKPKAVMNTLFSMIGADFNDTCYSLCRTEIFTCMEDGILIPLCDVGTNIG